MGIMQVADVFGRHLSRRAMLRGGLVLATLPLLAACGPGAAPAATSEPPKTAGSKPAAPAAAPSAVAVTAPGSVAPTAVASPAVAAGARGSGGTLKMLLWQGPTIVNPHLAQGIKDSIAARAILEPLLTQDNEGRLSPVLAAEVPTKDNGGLSADGRSVTYKLKKDIKWADGQPFTADDVLFTFQFVTNKETAATTIAPYLPLDKVEVVDPLTVKLTFKGPTGGWFVPFTGANGWILPKHALDQFTGSKAREAPFNLKAFGTGPFMVDDFKPGDLLTYKANPNYREPGKPFFDRIEIKGGGDATSAARSVFQTGEYDYAWNLQVEAQVLDEIMKGDKGDLMVGPGLGVEQIYFNMADPNQDIDGERSSPKSTHPFLTDPKVREAMALAIDRETIAKQLYGPTGDATPNVLTTPSNLASKNTKYEFNLDKANQLLDAAGYKKGGDGIRMTPSGVRMKVLYQTSTNSLRQKEQALVKDGWQKLGIDTELKSIDAGVFFSVTPTNPDTSGHFYADVQMTTSSFDSAYPANYMKRFYSAVPERDFAQKSNNWSSNNFMKWSHPEYNKLYEQGLLELDPVRANEIWKKANDIVVNAFISVPLIDRKLTDAKAKAIKGPELRPFDHLTWNIADWTRS
jgi:peptide/nickel transport system substrate-binding protein